MTKIALIDADVLVFQAAVVAEKATDWGDGVWTLHADEGDGLHPRVEGGT